MRNKSVAVIDVRSSEITAAVAERGVNNTFVIKSKFTSAYDGYAEGQMIDAQNFENALRDVLGGIISASDEKIKSIYVGVPDEFVRVTVEETAISFKSPKKVKEADVLSLARNSLPKAVGSWAIIRSACLYYVLSDLRRTVNPVGMLSDSLRGRISYYFCKKSFIDSVNRVADMFGGITRVNFIPIVHAQAMYLLPPERRDEYAVLFDFGYISSTYSVACGNGVVYCQSFSLGEGHIALYLTEALGISYEAATAILGKVNLNSKEGAASTIEYADGGKMCAFPTSEIKEKVREGLDGICETIEECIQSFSERNTEFKPIYLTGESAESIRGASDHISGRLVRTVNIIAPNIPYYDKPRFSSLFSLMNMALEDEGK